MVRSGKNPLEEDGRACRFLLDFYDRDRTLEDVFMARRVSSAHSDLFDLRMSACQFLLDRHPRDRTLGEVDSLWNAQNVALMRVHFLPDAPSSEGTCGTCSEPLDGRPSKWLPCRHAHHQKCLRRRFRRSRYSCSTCLLEELIP